MTQQTRPLEGKVRFGLIGFGAWGRHHADAIHKTPGAELVAIGARSEASCAAARAAYPEARVYAHYEELLADNSIEIVDIVVPSYLHHEIARQALEAGKHLLLEKPMAITLAECDDLIATARRHDDQHVEAGVGEFGFGTGRVLSHGPAVLPNRASGQEAGW